ncbi:MAG: hypothetical protein ACT4N8_09895 [Sphingosinicella sp.]|uniref:hypothetical protein n=1 Tax=Sphingosinicella sp. TaxID=1917971 RepID=UPI0040376F1F
MNRINLFKDLARTGFHTSIVTTYSVDAAFYDGSLFRRLRTYGCENNILMADARMLQRAVEATPESFARAGSGYAAVPIAVEACFHPKIHIRLGTDSASLIVGSANATAAGWGRNREIVSSFEWWRRRDDADEAVVRRLVRKAYDYAASRLSAIGTAAIEHKLRLIERDSAWLFDVEANDAPLALADGSWVDLYFERDPENRGMLARLIEAVDESTVRRLIVVSPYWDGDLAALAELRDELRPAETVVGLNARKPEFPVDALPTLAGLRFAKIFDGSDGNRFIHAKVLLVETDRHDHLLIGSANCSVAAMGSMSQPARNAECSVYRRLPAGVGLELLGIDLTVSFDVSAIRSSPGEIVEPSAAAGFYAGTIEAAGRSIRWRPSPKVGDPQGAKLRIADEAYRVARVRDGMHCLELPAPPALPLIVRVELADGRVSAPVLVNDEVKLAQAAPGLGDRRLRAAYEKIALGEGDLLDLAALASLIFSSADAPVRRSTKRSGGGGKGGDESNRPQPEGRITRAPKHSGPRWRPRPQQKGRSAG